MNPHRTKEELLRCRKKVYHKILETIPSEWAESAKIHGCGTLEMLVEYLQRFIKAKKDSLKRNSTTLCRAVGFKKPKLEETPPPRDGCWYCKGPHVRAKCPTYVPKAETGSDQKRGGGLSWREGRIGGNFRDRSDRMRQPNWQVDDSSEKHRRFHAIAVDSMAVDKIVVTTIKSKIRSVWTTEISRISRQSITRLS